MNEKQMKAQMDAMMAAQSRTQLQLHQLNQRLQQPGYQPGYQPQEQIIEDDGTDQNVYYQQPQVDPNQLMMQAVTQKAAYDAAQMVAHQQQVQGRYTQTVTDRMDRLVTDYPALTDENSTLVQRARMIYQRVSGENPGLDEATKYELSVREAASALGARPVTLPAEEDAGWTMGQQHNPSLPSKQTRSRLTPAIITNAKLFGLDVDPKSRVGQANLKELSEYSARFNADRDESHVKYR